MYKVTAAPTIEKITSKGFILVLSHFLEAGYNKKINTKPKHKWIALCNIASKTPKVAVYNWKSAKIIQIAETILSQVPVNLRLPDSGSNFSRTSSADMALGAPLTSASASAALASFFISSISVMEHNPPFLLEPNLITLSYLYLY